MGSGNEALSFGCQACVLALEHHLERVSLGCGGERVVGSECVVELEVMGCEWSRVEASLCDELQESWRC